MGYFDYVNRLIGHYYGGKGGDLKRRKEGQVTSRDIDEGRGGDLSMIVGRLAIV